MPSRASPRATARDVDAFIDRYAPPIAADLREARAYLHACFPQGYELVYDNYNALVFGFSPTERASDAIVSLAAYPRWITLFFLKGASLPDPAGMLEGTGSRVRSVRLQPASRLRSKAVGELLAVATASHASAFALAPRLATIVKSISVRQRPRRPPVGEHAVAPRRRA